LSPSSLSLSLSFSLSLSCNRNAATRTIDQKLKFVSTEQGKKLAMKTLISDGLKPPVLIFVQSKERAMALFHELVYWGLNADVISASRLKHERDMIVKNFRSGKIWYLISTDVMARGMDFQGVCTVINYDFPVSTVDYIHRIGRTGRAGRAGTSITFFTEEDRELLRSVANVMRNSGCPVEEWMLRLPKLSKQRKRELIRRPIRRKHISGRTLFDKRQRSNRGAIVPKTGGELAKQQKERKELLKRQQEKRRRKADHDKRVNTKKMEGSPGNGDSQQQMRKKSKRTE
jgi:ATP-dependent RNA helicase DDX52/ROK1